MDDIRKSWVLSKISLIKIKIFVSVQSGLIETGFQGPLSLNHCLLSIQNHFVIAYISLDILLEYWIKHVTFGRLYITFTSPTRILYRRVPGCATGCAVD